MVSQVRFVGLTLSILVAGLASLGGCTQAPTDPIVVDKSDNSKSVDESGNPKADYKSGQLSNPVQGWCIEHPLDDVCSLPENGAQN
jgi:hypothetical protein